MKNDKMKRSIVTIFLICLSALSHAQNERTEALVQSETKGWEYELRAGVNIGGASPIPLPKEIRKIKGYSPKFNGSFEGVVTKWLNSKWGISAGLRLEEKGMETDANVKNYGMEIIDQGNHVSGYWTGDVHTAYKSSFVTLPISVNYRLANRWKVRLGLFASYRMDGDFSGYVTDGYLREGTPIGEKVSFTNDQTASYNFSSNLRHWHFGTQLGGSWQAFKHFSINADVNYVMNNIFEKDFKTITFNMYPIYMNIGFGYRF
ncbi:membrane protein [Capnocytophaga sp. HP1101]